MYEKIRQQYDSLYAAQVNFFGEGKPIPELKELSHRLAKGTVLDIGGGEGRNALYLAELGFSVTVHDFSAVGLDRLQGEATKRNITITTRCVDVTSHHIEGSYDFVINTFLLHHLKPSDARRIIKDTQHCITEGGLHILSTFGNNGELYTRNKDKNRFYPSEDLLRELYAGWEIVTLRVHTEITMARNKAGKRLTNAVVTLVAKKPVD